MKSPRNPDTFKKGKLVRFKNEKYNKLGLCISDEYEEAGCKREGPLVKIYWFKNRNVTRSFVNQWGWLRLAR